MAFSREGIVENVVIDPPSDDELGYDLEKDKVAVDTDDNDIDSSASKDLKDIFEDCEDDEDIARSKIFIFGRTDRQKEDW